MSQTTVFIIYTAVRASNLMYWGVFRSIFFKHHVTDDTHFNFIFIFLRQCAYDGWRLLEKNLLSLRVVSPTVCPVILRYPSSTPFNFPVRYKLYDMSCAHLSVLCKQLKKDTVCNNKEKLWNISSQYNTRKPKVQQLNRTCLWSVQLVFIHWAET